MTSDRALLVIAMLALVCACRSSGGATATAPVSPTATAKPTTPTTGADLVGLWRVVKFCLTDSTDLGPYAFGPEPIGYFFYSASGEFALQVARPAGVPGMSEQTLNGLKYTPDERRAILTGYLGYFGHYVVTSDTTLIHNVEGGTMASYIGTVQHRAYRLYGKPRDSISIGDLTPG